MAAKSSTLGALHEALADLMMENIRICKEEQIPMAASEMAVIVKFLKDNDVTADIDDAKMDELSKAFADELKEKRETKAKDILAKASGSDVDPFLDLM